MLRPSPFLKSKEHWLDELNHCFIFDNQYPIKKGHVLIVPKREIENFSELTVDEWCDIQLLIKRYINDCGAVGFNMGFNSGKIAGQSVAHIHIHVFPHFEGDEGLPKGGCCLAFSDLPDYYKD